MSQEKTSYSRRPGYTGITGASQETQSAGMLSKLVGFFKPRRGENEKLNPGNAYSSANQSNSQAGVSKAQGTKTMQSFGSDDVAKQGKSQYSPSGNSNSNNSYQQGGYQTGYQGGYQSGY